MVMTILNGLIKLTRATMQIFITFNITTDVYALRFQLSQHVQRPPRILGREQLIC